MSDLATPDGTRTTTTGSATSACHCLMWHSRGWLTLGPPPRTLRCAGTWWGWRSRRLHCLPGGGANLRLKDVTLEASHLLIQVPNYKHGAGANREQLIIRVPRPTAPSPDPTYDLVRGHVQAMQLAHTRPGQPLFTPVGDVTPLPTEVATASMREGLGLLSIATPSGCLYSGRSLRACAATSARAFGVELDAIATLMGMRNKDTTMVTAVYVDALAVPDEAARELYDRYLVVRR